MANSEDDLSDLDDIDLNDFIDDAVDMNEVVPQAIRKEAQNIALESMPDKSKILYVKAYNKFKSWRKNVAKTNSFKEDVILVYFRHLSNYYSATSLWAFFSMLKTCIITFHQIDIGTYKRVILFLKKCMAQHVVKKSAVFTREHIVTFLNEASDAEYLDSKVILIFGIAGALRRGEFTRIVMTALKLIDEGTLLVQIPVTKNNVPRSFVLSGALLDYAMDYLSLRPNLCKTDRFFLNYQHKKCTQQPIGVNKFGRMPRMIATAMKLPNAKFFTGHSFRRTSATLLVDAGADLMTLKRHGGWIGDKAPMGYIAESHNTKKRAFFLLTDGMNFNKQPKTTIQESVKSVQARPSTSQQNIHDSSSSNRLNVSQSPTNQSLACSIRRVTDLQCSSVFNKTKQHTTIENEAGGPSFVSILKKNQEVCSNEQNNLINNGILIDNSAKNPENNIVHTSGLIKESKTTEVNPSTSGLELLPMSVRSTLSNIPTIVQDINKDAVNSIQQVPKILNKNIF